MYTISPIKMILAYNNIKIQNTKAENSAQAVEALQKVITQLQKIKDGAKMNYYKLSKEKQTKVKQEAFNWANKNWHDLSDRASNTKYKKAAGSISDFIADAFDLPEPVANDIATSLSISYQLSSYYN